MSRDEDGFDENHLLPGEVELWRNAQWRITNFALEEVPGRVTSPYWLRPADIHMDNWFTHMSQKNWVDMRLFTEALIKGRELFPQAVPV